MKLSRCRKAKHKEQDIVQKYSNLLSSLFSSLGGVFSHVLNLSFTLIFTLIPCKRNANSGCFYLLCI